MKFTIEIHLDNAAFDPPGPEVARILREFADNAESGHLSFEKPTGPNKKHGCLPIRDVNGNRCGHWSKLK